MSLLSSLTHMLRRIFMITLVCVFGALSVCSTPSILSAAILDTVNRTEVRPGAGNATSLELTAACKA